MPIYEPMLTFAHHISAVTNLIMPPFEEVTISRNEFLHHAFVQLILN